MKAPPPSNLKILRCATMIVEEYGQDAELQAAQHYDELLDQGDVDELLVWGRIVKAVRELLAEVVPEGQTVH